ncbi:MAG: hypothetical protein HY748_08045 [Elusimicrobia bacterium]|nr:hypothetical protein [Elusimicrobiota bacterium]
MTLGMLGFLAGGTQGGKGPSVSEDEDDILAVEEAKALEQQESADRKDTTLKPEDLAQRSQVREERAKELLTKHPESPRVHDAVAGIDYSAGRFEQGLERSGQAIALAEQKPDKKALVSALVNRGEKGYLAMGDYPKAYADAARALELAPKNPRAFALLKLTEGRVAAGHGGKPGPAAAGPSGQVAPSQAQTGESAGRQAQDREAQATAERLKAGALAREAAGKLGLGDSEAGRRLIDKAVGLDPENARILAARSRARLAGKDMRGALEGREGAGATLHGDTVRKERVE